MNKSSFGVIGLGVMGKSISLNVANKGFSLSVYNRSDGDEAHVVENFLKENSEKGDVAGFNNLEGFVNSLEKPRKILMMIKAGETVDQVLNALYPLLSANDIIIDGGNSHYHDTKRRMEDLAEENIHFIGAGISGGEEGALNGPSIMPGGYKEAYEQVAPVLEAIAAKDKSNNPCCTYIGPEGSGHFIKMVHNGIEYAEMQLLAEMFALMSLSMDHDSIAGVLKAWNNTELKSYLLAITADILQKKEGEQYLLDLILDQAGNKGTGSWSSKAAYDLGSVNTMMSEAVFARYMSSFKTERLKLSAIIKKQAVPSAKPLDVDLLKNAYHFARLINHLQGFELIRIASHTYDWSLNLAEIARIWTNGCIIKSTLMEELSAILRANQNLLENTTLSNTLTSYENAITQILQYGLESRVVLPVFTAAQHYWVAMTTEKLPANLIQAQRDFFGAHTYQRVDAPTNQFFHTNWQ